MSFSFIKPCIECDKLIRISTSYTHGTMQGVLGLCVCGKTGKQFTLYTQKDTPHWCPNVVLAERTIREWEEEQ